MPLSDHKKPDPFSKTQLKTQMTGLQKMGETLLDLPEAQLAKIALPDELLEAIHFFHSLKAHEAKRRQLQYIGKIMRTIDTAPIQASLAMIKSEHQRSLAQFHKIETWRDQLLAEGDSALQTTLEAYPQADRQQLRQLIRKAQEDRKNNKHSGAETELFKYLRALLKQT